MSEERNGEEYKVVVIALSVLRSKYAHKIK